MQIHVASTNVKMGRKRELLRGITSKDDEVKFLSFLSFPFISFPSLAWSKSRDYLIQVLKNFQPLALQNLLIIK